VPRGRHNCMLVRLPSIQGDPSLLQFLLLHGAETFATRWNGSGHHHTDTGGGDENPIGRREASVVPTQDLKQRFPAPAAFDVCERCCLIAQHPPHAWHGWSNKAPDGRRGLGIETTTIAHLNLGYMPCRFLSSSSSSSSSPSSSLVRSTTAAEPFIVAVAILRRKNFLLFSFFLLPLFPPPQEHIPFYALSTTTINTLLLFISTGYGPTIPLVKLNPDCHSQSSTAKINAQIYPDKTKAEIKAHLQEGL